MFTKPNTTSKPTDQNIINKTLLEFRIKYSIIPANGDLFLTLAEEILESLPNIQPDRNLVLHNWFLHLGEESTATTRRELDEYERCLIIALMKKGITFELVFTETIRKLKQTYDVTRDGNYAHLTSRLVVFMTDKTLFNQHMNDNEIKEFFKRQIKHFLPFPMPDNIEKAHYTFFWELGVYQVKSASQLYSLLKASFQETLILAATALKKKVDDFYIKMILLMLKKTTTGPFQPEKLPWLRSLIRCSSTQHIMLDNFEIFSKCYSLFAKQKDKEMFDLMINEKLRDYSIENLCDCILALGLSDISMEKRKQEIVRIIKDFGKRKDTTTHTDTTTEVKSYFDKNSNRIKLDKVQREKLVRLCQKFTKDDDPIIFDIEQQLHTIQIVDETSIPTIVIKKLTYSVSHNDFAQQYKKPFPLTKTGSNTSSTTTSSGKDSSKAKEPTERAQRREICFRLTHKRKDEEEEKTSEEEETSPKPIVTPGYVAGGTLLASHLKSECKTIPEPDTLPYSVDRFQKYTPDTSSADTSDKYHSKETHRVIKHHTQTETSEKDHTKDRDNKETGIWGEAACFFSLVDKYKKKYHLTESNKTSDSSTTFKDQAHPKTSSCYLEDEGSVEEMDVEMELDPLQKLQAPKHSQKNTFVLKRQDEHAPFVSSSSKAHITQISICWFNKPDWETWREKRKTQPNLIFLDNCAEPYDIRLEKTYSNGDRKIRYIEVKSTVRDMASTIVLTGKEFDFMRACPSKYRLIRCYNAKNSGVFFKTTKDLKSEIDKTSFTLDSLSCRF